MGWCLSLGCYDKILALGALTVNVSFSSVKAENVKVLEDSAPGDSLLSDPQTASSSAG